VREGETMTWDDRADPESRTKHLRRSGGTLPELDRSLGQFLSRWSRINQKEQAPRMMSYVADMGLSLSLIE